MSDLSRFLAAQEGVHGRALAELERGRKDSHWMWFIFPQIAGLGRSTMAQHYAIASLDEARAFLAHPELEPRLEQATRAVLRHAGSRTAERIFGTVDAAKFRSSMILFEAAGGGGLYASALDAFFAGARDDATLRLLGQI